MKETSIERIVGEEKCTLYTSERKFILKIEQYKEIYPDLVDFEKNSDGSIVAHVPFDWFKFISPKKKRVLTEEERKAIGERLKRARDMLD